MRLEMVLEPLMQGLADGAVKLEVPRSRSAITMEEEKCFVPEPYPVRLRFWKLERGGA